MLRRFVRQETDHEGEASSGVLDQSLMDQGPILFAVKSGYIFYKKSMNAQTSL
jgi:hypothetical protein